MLMISLWLKIAIDRNLYFLLLNFLFIYISTFVPSFLGFQKETKWPTVYILGWHFCLVAFVSWQWLRESLRQSTSSFWVVSMSLYTGFLLYCGISSSSSLPAAYCWWVLNTDFLRVSFLYSVEICYSPIIS